MAPRINEAALRLFASDLEAYGKVCLKIRTKGGIDPKTGFVEPPMLKDFAFNESQKLVHEILADQYKRTKRVRAIILKARQQGMSTYTSGRFFRKLHLWPNHQAVVVADELSRAETLFGMYDRYANHLPEEMKPMMRYVSKKKEMVLDNPKDALRAEQPGLGSGISVETAGDTEAGRGSTIQLAHLSEMASWPNALEVYVSLIQAVPDFGSEVIVESTAKGVGNLFHQMWEQAYEGEGVTEGANGYIAIFIPWWWSKEYQLRLNKKEKQYVRDTLDDYERSCMEEGFTFRGKQYLLNESQIAWRRWAIREKTHGDARVFQQEYPATPEEAFLASGACFFSEDQLRIHDKRTKPPKKRAMLVQVQGRGVVVRPTELGWLRMWRNPGEKDEEHSAIRSRYIIAADTATGRLAAAQASTLDDPDAEKGGRDFSSAHVVDVVRRECVAVLHGRMSPDIFAEQLHLLGNLYSSEERTGLRRPALLAVERNHSSGETVIRILKEKLRYPNLYVARTIGRRFDRRNEGQKIGWLTTVETRMPMLDNLEEIVRVSADLPEEDSFWIPDRHTIKEMFTFVRGEDGKPQAQQGAHDDRVISLAIACYLMETGAVHLEKPKNADWGTPDHQDRQREEMAASGTMSPTGFFRY